MSPAIIGEQFDMLCGCTPNPWNMSNSQITSASVGSLKCSSWNPWLPLAKPSVSRQTTVQRLVVYQRRLPSTIGVDGIPCWGQSCTWPDGSLLLTCCQRNLPVASSKHIKTL